MDKKILITLFVAILFVGGVFWLSRHKAVAPTIQPSLQEPVQQTAPQPTSQNSKNFDVVQGDSDYVWFPVPELGIEIKTRKDIAVELLYKIILREQSEKGILSAEFTTKKLIEMGERHGIATKNQSDRYSCILGVFTRYNMSEKEYVAMQEEVYGAGNVKPVDIDGYFVEYRSPQSGCSSGPNGYVPSDVEYEQFLVQNWPKRVNGISEPLTESVRKIK